MNPITTPTEDVQSTAPQQGQSSHQAPVAQPPSGEGQTDGWYNDIYATQVD